MTLRICIIYIIGFKHKIYIVAFEILIPFLHVVKTLVVNVIVSYEKLGSL